MLIITIQVNNGAPLLRLGAINRGNPTSNPHTSLRTYDIIRLNEEPKAVFKVGEVRHYRDNGFMPLVRSAVNLYMRSEEEEIDMPKNANEELDLAIRLYRENQQMLSKMQHDVKVIQEHIERLIRDKDRLEAENERLRKRLKEVKGYEPL